MDNIDRISGENYREYRQPTEEEGTIETKLPPEIFAHVLSYLNESDMEEVNLVSPLWSNSTLAAVKDEEFTKIVQFAKFLGNELEGSSYGSQINKLFDMGSDTSILNSVNLIQVKLSIKNYKEKIVNLLKDLKEDDLEKLEKLSKNAPKPRFFEHVFDLARVYKQIDKQIDQASRIASERLRDTALEKISFELIKKGYTDKAIEVAKMASPDASEYVLYSIARYLADADEGNIVRAIEIAEMISGNEIRDDVLKDRIAKALVKEGSLDRAIEIAETISDDEGREDVLKVIVEALVQKGGEAIEIVKTLSDEERREDAFLGITCALVVEGKTEKAIEVAEMISDDEKRGNGFELISFALAAEASIDRAIEIAETISDDEKRGNGFYAIALVMAAEGSIERAIEVAEMISDNEIRENTLKEIYSASTVNGSIELAIEVAETISICKQSGHTLYRIARNLADQGSIEKALVVAEMISDNEIRDEVLRDLNKENM